MPYRQSKSKALSVILISCLFLGLSCAGGNKKAETPPPAEIPDAPLAQKYENIVVFDIEATPEVKKDYPEAAKECQASLISALNAKKAYQSVTVYKAKTAFPKQTLLVKANIKEMRIVATSARIWGGAFAGSSYMNMEVVFVEAATQKEVRKKEMNSSTNAWAATWTSGASDRSLPSDMGNVIAEYLISVVHSR